MCRGTVIDDRPQNEVQIEPDKLEVVASFYYLGDMLTADGGCELAVTTRCENHLKEVQGATSSSHIPPTLLQDPWPCIQLLRAKRHAPCQ